MRRLMMVLVTVVIVVVPASRASAARWSTVTTPKATGLEGVACVSTHWCEAVGGWYDRLTSSRWDGVGWVKAGDLPQPGGRYESSSLVAIACISERFCMAIGQFATSQRTADRPLVEQWKGARWTLQSAPSAPPSPPYRTTNSTLAAVACPRASLALRWGGPWGAERATRLGAR